MNWTEISIHTTHEAVEAITNMMHEHGASGVVIEDPSDLVKVWDTTLGEVYELNPEDYPKEGVILKAYLPQSEKIHEIVQTLKENINNLTKFGIEPGPNTISIHEVHEEDWATSWKKYYKPVTISDTITIVPTWEEYNPRENELVIELDPGMAFGTGTHPTTVMCLQALEKYLRQGDNVIDVGTGSGVLSIGAAKLGAKNVRAYDLDEVAVKSAIQNIELNQVSEMVTVEKKNLLHDVEEQADIIVGNLLAEIITTFVNEAYQLVREGGHYITSGIIGKKEELVTSSLKDAGFHVIEVIRMDDWVAIIAKK